MLTSRLLLFLVTILSTTTAQSRDQCHCEAKSTLFVCPLAVPCGAPNVAGFVACCVRGDVCGADGFCHFTHPQSGTSGYYLASCTDPTYRDSSCPTRCSKFNMYPSHTLRNYQADENLLFSISRKQFTGCGLQRHLRIMGVLLQRGRKPARLFQSWIRNIPSRHT